MRSERIALALLFIAYVVWAGLFIYRSSYVAIDGQRYFGLFDDAMISMRYAWNFAHGLGLVWNAGERVEGYSNLLMTLGMSLAALLLDKRLAVLAVQISGIPVMLGIAYLGWRIATGMNKARPWRRSIGFIACACILFYYPLDKVRSDTTSSWHGNVSWVGFSHPKRLAGLICHGVCLRWSIQPDCQQ
jgi:hypothetical protein